MRVVTLTVLGAEKPLLCVLIDPADLKTVNTIVTDSLTGASTLLVAAKQ
jgi:hypothetical protein